MRACVDVETDGREALAEFDGERQADIAEPDDPDARTRQVEMKGCFHADLS